MFKKIALRPIDTLRAIRHLSMAGDITFKSRNEVVISVVQLQLLGSLGVKVFDDHECRQELDIKEACRQVMTWHEQGNMLKCGDGARLVSSIYRWSI